MKTILKFLRKWFLDHPVNNTKKSQDINDSLDLIYPGQRYKFEIKSKKNDKN